MRRSQALRGVLLCSTLSLSLPLAAVRAQNPGAAGQGGTVIAAEADTPSSLNPLLNQQLSTVDIDSAVFDSMVKVGDKGQFMPDLASSWTSSPDGLRWVFKLNPKATWQDGVPFTADDVVFTTNLVNNPLFPATSSQGFDHVKSIKAVGKEEVDVTLSSPYAPFLQYWGAAVHPAQACPRPDPGRPVSAPTTSSIGAHWVPAPSRSASSPRATT